MNLLEHYIKEIHSVRKCEEEWTKEDDFKDKEYVEVDLTYDCYGCIERRTRCWDKEYFEYIKEKGYFMA